VLAIFSVIAALAGITFGRFADRLGRRRMAIAGLAAMAFASAAGATVTNIPALLATRVVEGVGFIAMAVSIPPLLASVATTPADRRLALGLWSSYIPMGSAIVLLAAPLVIAFGGWRTLWLGAAGAAALAACAIAASVRGANEPAAIREPFWAGARTVIAAGAPLVAGIAFGAYAASYFILVGFLPTILVASGRGVGVAALLTLIVVVANGLGNISGGIASRRFARVPVLVVGAGILGAGGALEYLTGLPLWLRVGAASIAAYAGGLIPGTLTAALPQLSPAPRLIATTQGVVLQCSNIGQLVGPVAVAALGAARGGPPGSVVMLVLAAIGIAAALSLRPDRLR
jgi:predicted MFS family arabinose efflux permease